MLGFFKKCFSSWSQEAQHAFSCHVLFRERSHESLLSNRWCWNINSISSGFEKYSYIHFLHVLRLTMSIDLVLICQIWRWLPLYQPSATYVKRISFLKMTILVCLGEGKVRYFKNLDLHDSGLHSERNKRHFAIRSEQPERQDWDVYVELHPPNGSPNKKKQSFPASILHSQFHLRLVFTGPKPKDPTCTVINDKEKPLLVFPVVALMS